MTTPSDTLESDATTIDPQPSMSPAAEQTLRFIVDFPIQGWIGEFAQEIVRLRALVAERP